MEDPVATMIAQVAAQDRAAFRALYSATAPKLMGVLLRILGTRSEAEDALQEVFTRVWLRAGRFDPEKGRGMTWLIALARNLAIDRLRSRSAATPNDEGDALDAIADTTLSAEGSLIAKGEARRIADCFATLEPERAAAVRGAGRALVEFSPARWDEVKALKGFLFARMYRHPQVVATRERATAVVTDLYEAFLADPALLPPDWAALCGMAGDAATGGVARDYIAGMTDNYALKEYGRVFHTQMTL